MELKEILEDYNHRFSGKTGKIVTNYKKYSEISVRFHQTDIPHLLGLHKAYSEKTTILLDNIQNGLVLREHLSKEILSRVDLYPYVINLFSGNLVAECVFDKDIKPNSMRLTVAILTEKGTKTVVLGLRMGKDEVFHLVTMHETSTKIYSGLRKSKIISIELS